MIHGSGKIFQGGRKIFDGNFKNGLMHGPGKYYFSNRNMFIAFFVDGQKHGPAKFIIKNPKSPVIQVDSLFKKNELERITGIILKKKKHQNLNEIAQQKKMFEENQLKHISNLTWESIKALSKKQSINLGILEQFEKEIIDTPSEVANSENSEPSIISKNSENSYSEYSSDKSDSMVEDEAYCDDFECSRSNWEQNQELKKEFCEHCRKKALENKLNKSLGSEDRHISKFGKLKQYVNVDPMIKSSNNYYTQVMLMRWEK